MDSNLDPEEMVVSAQSVGLDGVCITEHAFTWDPHDFREFARQQSLVLIPGMEVDTEYGHILVFGLNGYLSGIHKAEELRRQVTEHGGIMVVAHPFRRYQEKRKPPYTVDEAVRLPVFQLVDEVEVANGYCTEKENAFTLEVARRLGFRGTGGSDAHSANGLGLFTTYFEREFGTLEEFLQEMKAGRFFPAQGLLNGGPVIPFRG